MNPQNVQTASLVEKRISTRPKARLFGLLALIWFGILIVCSIPFWGPDWRTNLTGKFADAIWLFILLVLPGPVFAALALNFFFTETPVRITELHPNPNYNNERK